MRKSSRHARNSRYGRSNGFSTSQVLTIIGAAVLAIAVAAFFYYQNSKEKVVYDRATACPMVGDSIRPKAQTVVVIDETDVLTPHQRDYLKVHLKNFVNNEIEPGELLSIYILDDQIQKARRPIFEMCKMRDGSDARKFTENQRLMAKRFQQKFQGPLMNRIDETLSRQKSADSSPIFETLQTISVNSFDKYQTEGLRRLVMFSDMLHYTPQYSMFTTHHSFTSLKESDYYSQIKTFLPDTAVKLYFLSTYPQYQKQELVEFWKKYFKDTSAFVDEVIPVGR